MTLRNKKEPLLLFLGDAALFVLALWIMLFLRHLTLPTSDSFYTHLVPFSVLFFVWVTVFFIAGLYDKRVLFLKDKPGKVILNAQIANSVIAVVFFYFIPYFGITPKVNLFIYLGVSFVCILLWRVYGETLLHVRKKERALLIGSGKEMKELEREVANNPRYAVTFVGVIDLDGAEKFHTPGKIVERIDTQKVSLVVINTRNHHVDPLLPLLYKRIFSGVRFVDMHRAYEDIFDRVPLSLLRDDWFLENLSSSSQRVYDGAKRVMDIVISIPLLVVPALCYPFIFFAMMFEDGGQVFSVQARIGQYNRLVKVYKFRTMTIANDGGVWGGGNTNRVTRVGAFLRKTRLDEFPQLFNVLKGDLSLVGPRPEFLEPVRLYESEVPYYAIRHIVKPGLSGWAQIYGEHPHHGTDIETTKNKLSYDLYYLKNRSFFLDLKIALKTVKTLFSRSGI